MNTVTTAYKHNGVPVSVPSGSYGVTRLTPGRMNTPRASLLGVPFYFTDFRSILYVSQPKRRRVPLVRSEAAEAPASAAHLPRNQAAAERIFDFIEVLKKMMKQKGYS